ncbi:hypothetical protein AC579_9302 [Pseudocercospora musae]|uniref:Uncharacterized protein n=1 Tax=Pseudocercospora musae TaxID=113226 RepID=A0A139I517_9PEZI|nr:hypothetical protein AC579_9302 [Pseudocercospora musae]
MLHCIAERDKRHGTLGIDGMLSVHVGGRNDSSLTVAHRREQTCGTQDVLTHVELETLRAQVHRKDRTRLSIQANG